jgi:hypothetical protein
LFWQNNKITFVGGVSTQTFSRLIKKRPDVFPGTHQRKITWEESLRDPGIEFKDLRWAEGIWSSARGAQAVEKLLEQYTDGEIIQIVQSAWQGLDPINPNSNMLSPILVASLSPLRLKG